MKTLFVFGAGCSKNYVGAKHRIPRFSSPVNSDFFKMARLVLQNITVERTTNEEITQLFQYLCQLYNIEYEASYNFLNDKKLLDLEAVMTELYIQELLFENHAPRTRLFEALVELISFTIAYALNGSICPTHQRILEFINEGDVVISFNYDLLVDDSARETKLMNDSNYLVDFSLSYQNGDWVPIRSNGSSFELLKLHGSLNWIKCSNCSRLFIFNPSDDIFEQLDFRLLRQLNCPHCHELGLKRMIIPPMQGKEYDQPPFSSIWKYAAEKIQNIERVVLLGYSLPFTDFAAVALLRRILFTSRAEDLEFYILNPDRTVSMRVEKLFPHAPPAKVSITPEIFIRDFPI